MYKKFEVMSSFSLIEVLAFLSPFVASYATYFFAIRGKRKDIDIDKEKKINIVLSNYLVVWHYMERLNFIYVSFKESKNLSMELMPIFMMKEELGNRDCFLELDKSIIALKEFSPTIYLKLEGVGKGLKFLEESYILPMFNPNSIFDAKNTLKESLESIEENIELISEQLGKKELSKVKKIFKERKAESKKEIEEDVITKDYFNILKDLMPNEAEPPTFEEFKTEISNVDNKEIFQKACEMYSQFGIKEIMEEAVKNPMITSEEFIKIKKEA